MATNSITQTRLKELLEYDPTTGEFRWRVKLNRNIRLNSVAGTINNHGYRMIVIDRDMYSAARLAWFYTYGEWPVGDIDHINRTRSDNRLCNLRSVSRSGNNQNKLPIGDVAGVTWHERGQKWIAAITLNRQNYHLGSFDDRKEAIQMRQGAEKLLHHCRPT
jgi:hypothetical protein